MIHWQQVFVHFDECLLLNIRFGEGRVTDTDPALAELKGLPQNMLEGEQLIYLRAMWVGAGPDLLSPCQLGMTQHPQTCSRCPAIIWLM